MRAGEKGDAHHQQQQLPAGSHTFAFQFQLPNINMPSSVEAKYGHIRYECKATVSVPWMLDVHTSSPFTVEKIIDLNLASPAIKVSVTMVTEPSLQCRTLASVARRATVHTDVKYCRLSNQTQLQKNRGLNDNIG
jgi:hypothetical protein